MNVLNFLQNYWYFSIKPFQVIHYIHVLRSVLYYLILYQTYLIHLFMTRTQWWLWFRKNKYFSAIYKTSNQNLVQFFYVPVSLKPTIFSWRTQQYRQSNILLCLMAACQKDTFFPYEHIFHELIQIGKTIPSPFFRNNNGFVSDTPCT